MIFVTWDEGEGEDGPIGMIVMSPLAKGGGYSNSIHYTHSSTLLTMQEIFNVGPLLGDATNATDLSDLFVFGAQLAVSPASGLSSSGDGWRAVQSQQPDLYAEQYRRRGDGLVGDQYRQLADTFRHQRHSGARGYHQHHRFH